MLGASVSKLINTVLVLDSKALVQMESWKTGTVCCWLPCFSELTKLLQSLLSWTVDTHFYQIWNTMCSVQMAAAIQIAKSHSHACLCGLGMRLLFRWLPYKEIRQPVDKCWYLPCTNTFLVLSTVLCSSNGSSHLCLTLGDSIANSHALTDLSVADLEI